MSVIVFVAGAFAAGATGSFFSDTETSSGNTFTAGAIDLKIDNSSYYNGSLSSSTSWSLTDLTIQKFFDFSDVKPSDYGEDTISLHVDNNDAYLCANVTLTSNDDNGLTEPESEVDQTAGVGQGELADEVNFIWWADDGDNVLEDNENVISQGPIGALGVNGSTTVPLADSENNIWTGQGGPVPGAQTLYIGKAWCFGGITANPLDQDNATSTNPSLDNNDNSIAGEPADGGYLCDGSDLDNSTQSDSLTADVTFTAVQARHNDEFLCTPPPPPPVRLACTPGQEWADTVVTSNHGNRKDGSLILVDRRNPTFALGPAQTTGTPSDAVVTPASFFSLGFNVGTTTTRSLTVAFNDNIIVNATGSDVRIYEVTGGVYPDEHIMVEASQNGIGWTTIAADAIRDADIDLGALPWARYIRITDINTTGPFPSDADGYDVDAVRALNCEQTPVV